ncbi:MAG: hypothetical protein ABII09_01385, partial [Planctomycetota bacterium]
QCGGRGLPAVRKNPFIKHWLSFPNVSFAKKNIGRMSHFLLSNCFQRAKINLIFLETAGLINTHLKRQQKEAQLQ